MTNFENLDPTRSNRNTASSNAKSSKATVAVIVVLALIIGAIVFVFSDWGATDSQLSQTATINDTVSNGQEIPSATAPAPAAP